MKLLKSSRNYIFLGSSSKSLPFSHVLLHNSLKNLCCICLVGLRWEHSAITTWIFDSVNGWCIKGLQCCISMTRSKLSWLHGLFGDDTLISRQHFVFSENMWFVFRTNHMILHTFVISLRSLDMLYDRHENIIPWVEFNIVKRTKISSRFLGLFYFCIVKRQSRTVLSSVLLFFLCDLWADLWPVTCGL